MAIWLVKPKPSPRPHNIRIAMWYGPLAVDSLRRVRHNETMAKAAGPPNVKLICGIISGSPGVLDEAITAVGKLFGAIDIASERVAFDLTDYYEDQMGSGLLRQFVSFAQPRSPDVLVQAKQATNALEAEIASRHPDGPARPVNLDPGYIEQAKLVLASMKNFAHRIHLAGGVYGEVTLLYRKGGGWSSLPWTFPDYASGRYDTFLTAVREKLRQQAYGKDPT